MIAQYKNVYPVKRIIASIYDSLLLLSIIFILGYFSVFISNGLNWELPENPSQPLLPGWYALLLICISSWAFLAFFGFVARKPLVWLYGKLKFTASMVLILP